MVFASPLGMGLQAGRRADVKRGVYTCFHKGLAPSYSSCWMRCFSTKRRTMEQSDGVDFHGSFKFRHFPWNHVLLHGSLWERWRLNSFNAYGVWYLRSLIHHFELSFLKMKVGFLWRMGPEYTSCVVQGLPIHHRGGWWSRRVYILCCWSSDSTGWAYERGKVRLNWLKRLKRRK